MKTLLSYLPRYLQRATETERNIVQFWMKHTEKAVRLNIRELATETFTSPSSIIRLCQKLGYEGYKEVKAALIYEIAVREKEKHREVEDLTKEDTLESIIEKIALRNIASLKSTAQNLNPKRIKECVDLMEKAQSIRLFGMGTSLLAAKDFNLKLTRMNKLCLSHDDWHAQLLLARNISPNEVAVLFSYSGMTREMIECAKIIKESGAKLITVCGFEHSTIAKLADYNIEVVTNEHIYRSGAMSSRIAQLNVVDVLFNALLNRNYELSVKQVSKTHIQKEEESR